MVANKWMANYQYRQVQIKNEPEMVAFWTNQNSII